MASTSTLTTEDKVIMKHGRAVLTLEIAFELNEALQKSYVPLLKNEFPFFKRLKGDRKKKFGDYMCYNILHVCDVLRSDDPKLFEKTTPKAIAQVIKDNFPKSDMLEVKLHDFGFLTFKLSGPWMIERIRKNLAVGIAAWAPIMPFKRVIIDFPHNDSCQSVRSIYIRNVLKHMLEYCGVEVGGRTRSRKALREVKKYFNEDEGYIKSTKRPDFYFLREKKALLDPPQPSNVYEDLAALWCGAFEQKAEWIVYITPILQREYLMQCFDATREFWDEHGPTLSYLGYETVSNEKEFFAELLLSESIVMDKESWLYCSGYSYEAIVDGTMKYAYLKTLTYSGCTLNAQNARDLLNTEGDTFIHLLRVLSRIDSFLNREIPLYKPQQALSDREREVGLQLLQFTEIIEDSILRKVPYLLCEYLYALSSNISSYILEDEFSESGVLLCNAARVVMTRSFFLLGITPECPLIMKQYFEKANKYQVIRDRYISSSPPSRTVMLRSRFEIFSMSIEVPFEEGNLFGGVMLTDTFGTRTDNWCGMDKKGRGQVDYFSHNWEDAVKFCDNSLISFGDRKCGHSVPFSSAIQMDVRLWATSKDGKSCYQLSYIGEEMKLLDFWEDEEGVRYGTWSVNSRIGSLHFYYCLLREAVDSKLSLKCAGDHLRVRVSISAYYGGGRRHPLHQYRTLIFDNDSTNLVQGELTLKRSMMAVPIDGSIVFAAHLVDLDTEVVVTDKREYKPNGKNKDWIIEWNDNCRLTLKVEWFPDR